MPCVLQLDPGLVCLDVVHITDEATAITKKINKMAKSLPLPPYPAILEDGRQKGSKTLLDNNGFNFRFIVNLVF
jgi:hypothetical protein